MKPSDQRKRVEKFVNKWKPRLFLHEWYITIAHPREDDPNVEGATANIRVNPVYLSAHINIFPRFWCGTLKEQEETIVHELCHCVTQEAWDLARAQREGQAFSSDQIRNVIERLTQRMTNVAFQNEW